MPRVSFFFYVSLGSFSVLYRYHDLVADIISCSLPILFLYDILNRTAPVPKFSFLSFFFLLFPTAMGFRVADFRAGRKIIHLLSNDVVALGSNKGNLLLERI